MKSRNYLCLLFAGMVVLLSLLQNAQAQSTIKIDAAQKGEAISPYIYGQFIEHLGRCIDGGIWAEMLADRKFYYDVDARESPWKTFGLDVKVVMDKENPFCGEHSPKIVLDEGDYVGSITQRFLAFQKDRKYSGYIWLKCDGEIKDVRIMLDSRFAGRIALFKMIKIPVKSGDFYRQEFEFEGPQDAEGQLTITVEGTGNVTIGTVSLMPADNVNGMRADTLQLLKELNSPIYRWPGGNFVSGYDWRDGVGERDRRPPRKNPAWRGVEHNDFGLDEFMTFCKELGTEPYIAVNTGAGEVDNALAELQYANGPADSDMGKLRAKNGHAEPYNVKFWGIGNEMYGDWQIGHIPVEQYAEKHNQFVDAFRKFDPNVKVIAVGAVGKWDEVIMRQCTDFMDFVSEHFYVQQRDNVIEHVALVPREVKRIADAHRKYREDFPELRGKDIRIALDEWNYWYGEHVFGELGTRYFMKDGLGVAAGLHEYFRNSDIFEMANYAQTVNVIGCIKTNKTNAQFETTGLALKLYRNQFGVIPLKTEAPQPFDVIAALTEDHKFLTLGIINPTDKAADFTVEIPGVSLGAMPEQFVIANADPMAHNDPGAKQIIDIERSQVSLDKGKITVAPISITVLRFYIHE